MGTLFALFEFMSGERVGAGELWGALPRASGGGAGGQRRSPVSGRDRRRVSDRAALFSSILTCSLPSHSLVCFLDEWCANIFSLLPSYSLLLLCYYNCFECCCVAMFSHLS